MTIGRTLLRASVESPLQPLTSAALVDWLGGRRSHAGVAVDEEKSLTFSAVYRCVSLIAGGCASLPLKTYDRVSDTERERVHVPLIERPHPALTPFEFWELMFAHALLWGNATAYKRRDNLGRVIELWPLLPSRVAIRRDEPSTANPSGKLFKVSAKNGTWEDLTSYEIFHVPGMGYDGTKGESVIGLARQAIGMGLAMEEYGARFFGSGALMSGLLKTDKALKQDHAELLQKRFQEKIAGLGRAHEVAVLDSGLEFQALSIPNEDSQFLESRSFQLGDIARFFGVPPHKIGDVERSTSWGQGIEAQTVGFYVDTQRPWLTRFEQRVTYDLLERRPRTYAEFDIEGTLRADIRAQYDAIWRATGRPWLVPNEVRPLDNRGPIPGGDELYVPAGMTPATPFAEPAPEGGSTNGQVPAAAQG